MFFKKSGYKISIFKKVFKIKSSKKQTTKNYWSLAMSRTPSRTPVICVSEQFTVKVSLRALLNISNCIGVALTANCN